MAKRLAGRNGPRAVAAAALAEPTSGISWHFTVHAWHLNAHTWHFIRSGAIRGRTECRLADEETAERDGALEHGEMRQVLLAITMAIHRSSLSDAESRRPKERIQLMAQVSRVAKQSQMALLNDESSS